MEQAALLRAEFGHDDMQDSALRLTDALGVSPPAGSAAASTAPYADTVSASAPEAPEAPAAASAGSQVPTKQRAPSPADAQAAARASAPAPASVQVTCQLPLLMQMCSLMC